MDQGPREELIELTASLRAHLEWHAATGAAGLPSGTRNVDYDLPREPVPLAVHEVVQAPCAGGGAAHVEAPPVHAPHVEAPPVRAPHAEVRGPREVASAIDARPQARPVDPGGAPDAPAQGVPDTVEQRRARLALVAEEVRACQKCGLHAGRTRTVFSRGSPLSELVFVGEGPGYEEDQQGEPFVGPAGQLLDRMIAAMGYRRDEVYICNIVKCRPPKNRKPEPVEMASCGPYLAAQLAVLKPRVLVALGATAVQGLIGTTEGITRLRGTWKLYKGTTPIMPTFHPAYLLRQPAAKREVWNDLKEVMRFLGKSPPEKG